MAIIGDDPNVVAYRKAFTKITGGPLAAILFQQILFRANNNKFKPFYKFASPCEHPDYKEGDSWQEELGFSRRDFIGARDAIALKVNKGASRSEIAKNALVIYWTDSNRKTWYEVTQTAAELICALYSDDQNANDQIVHYIEAHKACISSKVPERDLHSSETTEIPENINHESAGAPAPSMEKEIPEEVTTATTSAAEDWEALPSANDGQPPVLTPEVATPQMEKKQYVTEVSEFFADTLEHAEPSRTDKAAARHCFDLRFDKERLREYCDAKRGSYRSKQDSAEPTAYWIINGFDDWRQSGFPILPRRVHRDDEPPPIDVPQFNPLSVTPQFADIFDYKGV